MIAYRVSSLNRHGTVEITFHYEPSRAQSEMGRRLGYRHSAIQLRQVEVSPAPWGCQVQPKPKLTQGAGL